LKKLIVGILLIVCSISTAVRAYGYRELSGPAHLERFQPILRDQGRWQEEERRRQEEERRRIEEERRKQDERRRQEEDRRRQDERRRQEEDRRRQDERRRQEEDRRRQDEQRRQEEDRRRQDEQRRQEEDRRRQDEQRRQEEDRRRQEEDRRHQEERRPGGPPPPPPYDDRQRDPWGRARANQVIHDTDNYLRQAQKAARFGPYRYGLGKALAHQQEARNLYFDRQYQRSIVHSLRARKIAQDIIEENRPGHPRRPGPPPHGLYNDPIDNELSVKYR
jgi:hypothetical protein